MAKKKHKQQRVPVGFRYDAVHPEFLKRMAMIGHYAADKYGSWENYLPAPLEGDADPINHLIEHMRQYVMGERYDHFDGDPSWQLVAIAYNAMMKFHEHHAFGHKISPFVKYMKRKKR